MKINAGLVLEHDRFRAYVVHCTEIWPGFLLSLMVALATGFVAQKFGGPHLLYALILGMGLHTLLDGTRVRAGIEFTARSVLRLGVALLGARVTVTQVAELGIETLVLVVAAVALTILFGRVLAGPLGLHRDLGMLSGGATAICGVSAAMALSAVMPRSNRHETHLIATVVGVTSLSTLAMILYPLIVKMLGLGTSEAGIFLGGSIHDVAQVVGAGNMISPETGDAATVVKLMRVALLMPAVLVFGVLYRVSQEKLGEIPVPILPLFLVGFVALVLVNSAGFIPQGAAGFLDSASRWSLVTSIAALGVKTSLRRLATVGWRPVLLMILEALFIAAIVLGAVLVFNLG